MPTLRYTNKQRQNFKKLKTNALLWKCFNKGKILVLLTKFNTYSQS